MPRPANCVITTPHPVYPESIRLVEHRKLNRTSVEAQYRVGGRWTPLKVAGPDMASAWQQTTET